MAGGWSGTEEYTTDEALSRLGFGRFQVLLLGFLGTGFVAEAMEVMLLSFVGPSVKEEWGISGGTEGLITNVVYAGMLLGACVGGLTSDRYGRRYVQNFNSKNSLQCRSKILKNSQQWLSKIDEMGANILKFL